VGAVAPDVPILAMVKVDDWAGHPRFSREKEGTFWFLMKEISHSPLYPFYNLLPGKAEPGNIPKLGYMIGKSGLGYEYRYNYKVGEDVSKTRPGERVCQLILLAVWVKLQLFY